MTNSITGFMALVKEYSQLDRRYRGRFGISTVTKDRADKKETGDFTHD